MGAPLGDTGHGAQQRPDEGHDAELSKFDADVESEQSGQEPLLGQRHLGQDPGKAEAVDQAEREGDGHAQRLGTPHATQQSEVAGREQRDAEQRESRHGTESEPGEPGHREHPTDAEPRNRGSTSRQQPRVLGGDERNREADQRLHGAGFGIQDPQHRERERHAVRQRYVTQRIEHGYLEPESALAVPNSDGSLTLYSQGQGIFDDQRQVAAFLGVPPEKVQVALVPNGGAFGGKEDMSVQPHAALLTTMTNRPVKVTLTREQSIRVHPKRHPITMDYEVGCDAEGRLVGVRARMIGDTGAYASVGAKVLERAGGHACGPYRVDNIDLVATAVYTNNPPCGAMRGFGANQAHFAMESMMDQLADEVGMDRWAFRFLNAVDVGDIFSTGQVLEKSVGIKKTLLAVKPHWDAARAAGKPVGIGCGIKNSGIGNGAKEWGKCRLVVEAGGRVTLYNGYTEMGQGLLTILIQCVSEVTGIPPDRFTAKVDTTFALQCGQTTGSRATLFGGNAAILASEKLKAAMETAGGLDPLEGQVFEGDFLCDDTVPLGAPVDNPKTHTAFGYATQVVILNESSGQLEKVVAAHDVGRAINPILCRGQIEGSIHMGLGYALSEELVCDDLAMPQNTTMRSLGILRARHTPELEVILVEEHEPEGPFGAKGVGEIGLVPTAGAVQGALHMFDGERRHELPMKTSAAAAPIVGRKKSGR